MSTPTPTIPEGLDLLSAANGIVMYADRSRKERKLVASLAESDQAEFVAQTIRNSLGLNPQEV